MELSKSVEEYLSKQESYKKELSQLREIMLEEGLDETVKWGMPAYLYEGKNLMGIAAFKKYFGIWFHQGALLEDKAGKLVNGQPGKTVAMRQWRFNDASEIEPKLIRAYIRESIQNHLDGREIKPKRKAAKRITIPKELKDAFAADKKLEASFKQLSASCRREYAEYISEAKREDTRLRRLDKVVPMIKEQKGLNDKYR